MYLHKFSNKKALTNPPETGEFVRALLCAVPPYFALFGSCEGLNP